MRKEGSRSIRGPHEPRWDVLAAARLAHLVRVPVQANGRLARIGTPLLDPPFDTGSHLAIGSRRAEAGLAGGSAVSADGVQFSGFQLLQAGDDAQAGTWRFDAQADFFYDPRQKRYVGTMRACPQGQ